ncbi:TetR/AcrR family transcriptional regulator [Cedecea colo]|uniref:TetR/AcrR family transcriptional regulator n=1 Tax=Cedecea colo TaxID=2552946 RepID=A0ABX0VS87_9ENTR|nr:TetR/AcrR family transcriptional regulator [Cedecea colo]NIY49076.1 TetR/AcrR family transcriptional regulator [Cedecea colo]
MNTQTLHRKKAPTRLQRQLLELAAMIAGRDGIASLSLNALAHEAGVSKGGLIHQFPYKQSPIFALFARLLAVMDNAIFALMSGNPLSCGRFTRAYLNYFSALTDNDESRQLMVLSLAMPDEPVLRRCWRDWMLAHLAKGDALNNDRRKMQVRYAADGIWLFTMTKGPIISAEHRQALISGLLAVTLSA